MARHRKHAVTRTPAGRRNLPVAFSASDAKNEFGQVLDAALEKGAVLITKHDAPKAVLLSMERFDALSKTAADDDLDSLSAEFDRLLARMQSPSARKGMDRLFTASPKDLGRAAVAGARRRKRKRG